MSSGALVAHLAPPIAPGELWRAWSSDPLAWLLLLGALVLHTRGWHATPSARPGRWRWRRRAFLAAIATAAVAMVSPLDALSASLASAHMTQHLLLTVVVAPLLVLSAPMAPLLRGLPRTIRRDLHQLRWAGRFHPGRLVARHVVVVAAVQTVTLWCWHAAGPYELALRNDFVHHLEHLTFLVTALASWAAIILTLRRRNGPIGAAVLVLFGLSMQGSILGALLTFARAPWYPSYQTRTAAWGLTPLEDQQLAGVIMWVPGGISYLIGGLAATALWIAATHNDPTADRSRRDVAATTPPPVGEAWVTISRSTEHRRR